MEIRIMGYVAASLLLEREPKKWHALVMFDSGTKPTDFVGTHALSHLCLHFDDVDQPDKVKLAPSAGVVERGLQFARGKDKLLVSCRVGQSRSAAMAYLVCCQERSVAEAIGLLDPTRHRPNRLVIQIGDGLLGNPEILDQFNRWREGHSNINMSDYLERWEKEMEDMEAEGAKNRITGD